MCPWEGVESVGWCASLCLLPSALHSVCFQMWSQSAVSTIRPGILTNALEKQGLCLNMCVVSSSLGGAGT